MQIQFSEEIQGTTKHQNEGETAIKNSSGIQKHHKTLQALINM